MCALTGEMLLEIPAKSKTVPAVYDSVDQALHGAFVFRLFHGDKDFADMAEGAIAEIKGTLQLIKLRRKGVRKGLHGILEEMNSMTGSQNASCLASQLSDDPDMLCGESASKYYMRLFGHANNTEGFIVQARMMDLYSMFTACDKLPSKTSILNKLRAVTRDRAIIKLIQLHNDGVIQVDRRRFYPLACSLGVHLR